MQTNGLPPRAATASDPAADEPGYTPAEVRTTAVLAFGQNAFLAGHSDGVARLFEMTTGNLLRTFSPPAGSAGGAVVALSVYGRDPSMLVVGHAPSGTLHHYNVETGEYLLSVDSLVGLSALLPLSRFNALSTVHAGSSRFVISDLAIDATPQVCANARFMPEWVILLINLRLRPLGPRSRETGISCAISLSSFALAAGLRYRADKCG